LSYCPKCGNKIDENMAFCPKCGASLKAPQPQPSTSPSSGTVVYRRHDEKSEKQEKGEKNEKREKHEHPFISALIGGSVILILGVVWFLQWNYQVNINSTEAWAIIFIIGGSLIILGAIYGSIMVTRRHPKTS
jgi:uncharacterized membrane protein YvbJ